MHLKILIYAWAWIYALLLGACAFAPERSLEENPEYSQRELIPAEISVLSWNIQKGLAGEWPIALNNSYIDRRLFGFDLILIQEACISADGKLKDLQTTLEREGYGWQFATSFVSGVLGCSDGATTGVLVASKVQPLQTLALRSAGSEFLITPKASLAMLFPVVGLADPLLVINTHLLNFELISNANFDQQLQELINLVEQHSGPVLLAGDLNTRNQARMDSVTAAMLQACLRTVVPAAPDTRTTDRLHGDYALDHILFRGLRPLTPLQVGGEQAEGISDHNSISAVFSVVRNMGCR